MRRLFLILMIALLPLRGWVGDVMAMEMASQGMNAIELVAFHANSTGFRGQFDSKKAAPAQAECPGHAAVAFGVSTDPIDALASADAANSADDATNGHCNTCGVCQICHTVALPNALALSPHDFVPQMLPSVGSIRFASALAALGQKPPIS